MNLKTISILLLLTFSQQLTANTKTNEPDYEIDNEVFDIPGYGEISIEVPRIWNYNFTKSDEQTPPLITFYVLDDSEKEIFQLNLSVFWDAGYSRNLTSEEYIRSLVSEAGNNTLRYSDEDELQLKPIKGRAGEGYFFDLSDSSAGEDEYRFLTQGAISVGDVLLVFSLFSNDAEGILREAMFRSLKSAKHSLRKDV